MANKNNMCAFSISILLLGVPGLHAMLRGRNGDLQTKLASKVSSNPSLDFLRSAIPSHLQLMDGNERALQQHKNSTLAKDTNKDNTAHSNVTYYDDIEYLEELFGGESYYYYYNGTSVNCSIVVDDDDQNDDTTITSSCHICTEEDMCVDEICTMKYPEVSEYVCTLATSPESSGFPAAISVSVTCDLGSLLSEEGASEDACSCDSAFLDGDECSSCSFNQDCTSVSIDPFTGFSLDCPNMDFAPACE